MNHHLDATRNTRSDTRSADALEVAVRERGQRIDL
jgi:hypothetical protein